MMKMHKKYKLLAFILVFILLANSLFSPMASAYQSGDNWYHSHLDNIAKEIYDRLSTIEPYEKEIDFLFNRSFSSDADAVKFSVDLATALYQAFTAFVYECPEKFWVKKDIRIQLSMMKIFSMYQYTIKLNLETETPYQNDLLSKYNNFNSKLESINVSGSNRYEKVKSIYEYLCNTVTYVDDDTAHSAYGALINKRAVCEGYAKAFKAICDREGIPCILVSGTAYTKSSSENHMWNYVQMEDEKWYALDVTWDDQVGRIDYDYLLVGSNTHIREESFSYSHEPKTNVASFSLTVSGYTRNIDVNLEYPQLSKSKYEPSLKPQTHDTTLPPETTTPEETTEPTETTKPTEAPNTNTDIHIYFTGNNLEIDNENRVVRNVSANTQISQLIKNYDTLNLVVLSKQDRELSATDIAGTGTEIHIYHNNKYVGHYTLVVKGDIDGNGLITALDARTALRASAKLIVLDQLEFDAANVLASNSISASAARKILRVSSRLESL